MLSRRRRDRGAPFWSLVGAGPGSPGVDVVNDYLGYLADRGFLLFCRARCAAYAFDLLVSRGFAPVGLAELDPVKPEL